MTTTPHATIRRNVTVGRGIAVHAAMLYVNAAGEPTRSGYTLCGSEGRTPGASSLRVTGAEVTCKRCPAPVAEVVEVDEQGVTTDPAARAIIEARAAQLDAMPTDDEPAEAEVAAEPTLAEQLAAEGISTRTIGRDLYEVVRDGVAAGRVMMLPGVRWAGYDLAGTERIAGADTLAEAVDHIAALRCTPDAPTGADLCPACGDLRGHGPSTCPLGIHPVPAPAPVEPAERIAAEVAATEVPAYLRPALDAYGEALAAHGQTYGASPACECGRPFRTRQGVGLHISAEHKRAEREYTAAAAIARNRQRTADLTPTERLAARYGVPVAQVTAVVDEVLDGTPATDALDERPRPLDAGEVATAVATWGGRLGDGPAALAQLDAPSGTEWVVYCPRHRHYLVRASVTGTTWADEQAEARRYTRREAGQAAERATWLDHNPTPWALPSAGPALV